jgi:hypothetical protein
MKIHEKGKDSFRLALMMILISLLLLLLNSGTNAQPYSRPPTSEKEIKTAANKNPWSKSPEEMSSKEWAKLLRRIDRLESKVAKLESRNDDLLRELSSLQSQCKQARAKSTGIQKVARTGMRPNKNDAMISVAGMLSVWDQMDIIMDKLDEIIMVLSE